MPRLGKRPHPSSNRSRVNGRADGEEEMDDEEVVNGWGEGGDSEDEEEEEELQRSMMDQVKRRRAEEATIKREDIPVPGVIKSLHLINFMCHSRFDIDFGSRINFVIGRNGSGKSAILTAITLALGGRATITSRGKQIRSFIKTGESASKIILKLHNYTNEDDKHLAFKPDIYGKTITIERNITVTSSYYVVKGHQGKIIAEKKEEVDNIVDHFRIQIGNPICILNQEVSKNFLNSKNPKDKYKFFMQATQLDRIKNDYARAQENSKIARSALEDKQENLPILKREYEEAKENMDLFNRFLEQKEGRKDLLKEMFWARYWEHKGKFEDMESNLKKSEDKIEDLRVSIDDEEIKLKQVEEQREQTVVKLKQMIDEKKQFEPQMNEASGKLQEVIGQKRRKKVEMEHLQRSIKQKQTHMRELEDKINELQDQLGDGNAIEMQRQKRKKKLQQLEDRLITIKGMLDTAALDKNNALGCLDELKRKDDEYRPDMQRLDEKMKAITHQINALKSNTKDSVARFGAEMPELLRRLDREAHKFHRKPIGPIGNFITLRDTSCSAAVEAVLKGTLYGFVCDNMNDSRELEKIMRSMNMRRRPTIITRKFKERHDVGRFKVRHQEYRCMLDLLTIRDDQVFNCLVDQLQMENILYIPRYEEAERLLINPDTVPQNCRRAYTEDGSVMYPRSGNSAYRSYANDRRPTNILQADTKARLRFLEDERVKMSEDFTRLKSESNAVRAERQSKEKELRELMARINQLRTEYQRVEVEKQDLANIVEPAPAEVRVLEEEVAEIAQLISQQKESLAEKERELESLSEREKDAQKRKKELDEQLAAVIRDKPNLEQELNACTSERDALNRKKDLIENELRKRQDRLEREKSDLERERKSLEENHKLAIDVTKGKVIEKTRPYKDLKEEDERVEKFLQEHYGQLGNREEVVDKYQTVKARYQQAKTTIGQLHKYIRDLEKALRHRERGYRELRSTLSRSAQVFFQLILDQMGFGGELKVYHREMRDIEGRIHKEKTLELNVNPKAAHGDSRATFYKDTRSLSGGERSYSTVAFILSLWEINGTPFKILDEVDVFMDLITRKVSMESLISYAARKHGLQFIFLSPLKIHSPETFKAITSIYKMPEPERASEQNDE